MKKLAIIGASYLQMPLVKKAKEMGIEAHCFAWEEGAVCKDIADFFYPISILDHKEILKVCKSVGIDGITSIATDMAVPTINFVAEQMGLISNAYKDGLVSTNKVLMRDAFKANKVRVPEYITTEKSDTKIEGIVFPVIVKPVDRSGSRGVRKVERLSDIADAIQNAIEESFEKKAIVEEFIEGNEVSVESISWKGEHVILAVTDKVTTGPPHFVELAHHQPSKLEFVVQEKIKAETIKVLNSVNVQFGAGHTEFKITKTGEIFAIEVGARMGGDFIGSHLVQLSTGYDFVKGVIDVALNQYEVPVLNENNFSGVYFLCNETKEIQSYFSKSNDFEVEKEIQNIELKNVANSNDRSGYLIYKATERLDLL